MAATDPTPLESRDPRRIRAYNDYVEMPASDRSVAGLLRAYQQMNREVGGSAPTTNRETIYTWAKEDRWEQRLAALEQAEAEDRRAYLRALRKNQYSVFQGMLAEANEALLDLILSAKDEATRLRAISALYDRLGFVAQSKIGAAQRDLEEDSRESAAPAPLPERPADDAPEAEWAAYEQQRSNLRLVQ